MHQLQVTAEQVLAAPSTNALIQAALREDLGDVGDLTARVAAPQGSLTANVVARDNGSFSGGILLAEILQAAQAMVGGALDTLTLHIEDGAPVQPNQAVASISGQAALVVTAERTLLNFLGRMCGVATQTARYVAAARAGGAKVQVLDTRKTLPGWRLLDKYAVTCGGGTNHRWGLYDAVLVKDNHLAGLQGEALRAHLAQLVADRPDAARFVQVEVDTLTQFDIAVAVPGIDMILLDNFSNADLRKAVSVREARGSSVLLEASGGVNLDTITAIAATGVDRISVGALTHSAINFDLGLDAE